MPCSNTLVQQLRNVSVVTDDFSQCIEELQAKAKLYEDTGLIAVLDATACVLKSDTAIPTMLKEALKHAVAALENVPEYQKDWHPGSDGQVLDLIHPSLFPLVYQRSRILPSSTIALQDCLQCTGRGEILPNPSPDSIVGLYGEALWSPRFQWLPCNVSFPDGKNARIDSYINNLHPVDNKTLYGVIEKIITHAMPFWNVIYQCHYAGRLRSALRIKCNKVSYKYPPGQAMRPSGDPDSDEEEAFYQRLIASRIHDMPEPKAFESLPFSAKDVNEPLIFLGKQEQKIQVIVKLASIHLTPDKPEYKGGSWHIEGQLNEHIISTALYYYDNNNITDSHLSFRTKVRGEEMELDLRYEQNDFGGIEKIFGIPEGADNVQNLGAVLTREDRLIAFPNGFQHRVGTFRLVDPTKPGHRKILALFLVAPTVPIISTANVPPQQRDWWLREVKAGGSSSRISKLPTELIDLIGDSVDEFPIGLEEAKRFREELMAERGKMDEVVTDRMANYEFSFCEH